MFVEWTCISTILQCMPHRLLFTFDPWYPWYMAVSEAALTHLNAIPNPLVRMQSLIQRFNGSKRIKKAVPRSVSRAQTPTAEIRFFRGWWGDRGQKARDPHRWASKDGKVAQSEPGWSNGSHWSGRVMFLCLVFLRSCLAVWNCYKLMVGRALLSGFSSFRCPKSFAKWLRGKNGGAPLWSSRWANHGQPG